MLILALAAGIGMFIAFNLLPKLRNSGSKALPTAETQQKENTEKKRSAKETNDVKIIGWIVSGIGGLITFFNAQSYISKSSEIQAWYYYRTELESARTFLIVGIAILLIGVLTLLTTYLKDRK